MKSQLLIVTDIFKLSNRRQKLVIRMCIGRKGFAQIAEAHISSDRSVFKGLQQELINSIRIL